MLDITKDPQKVRDFFENMAEENKRKLFTLLQNFNKCEFFSLLQDSEYLPLIQKYKNDVPYFSEIEEMYHQVNFFIQDPANRDQVILFVLNPGQISDTFKGILKELHSPYKKYKKWLMQANNLLQPIKAVGPSPNREGVHFKAAQEMADAISSIWCVKKIVLFGSVARGEERTDSDIDLAIELFGDVRHSRKFVGRTIDRMIGNVLEPLRQKYTNVIGPKNRIWDIINLSSAPKNNLKVFNIKGFFANALTMFERAQPELVMDGNILKFDFKDILGWMDMGQGNYCLLFNGEEPMQIKAIGMDGNDVGWVGLLNFALRNNDKSYFRVKLIEMNLILSAHDDAAEEFENLPFWFDKIQWYRSWGEFDYKTTKFVILPPWL
jgi:hypothetical protein